MGKINFGDGLSGLIRTVTDRRRNERESEKKREEEETRKEREFEAHMDRILREGQRQIIKKAKENLPILRKMTETEPLKTFLQQNKEVPLWLKGDDRARIVLRKSGVYFINSDRRCERISFWSFSDDSSLLRHLAHWTEEKAIEQIRGEFELWSR